MMKIESADPAEDKARWKIVRTDDYTDVPGDIVTADEASGECRLQIKVGDGTKTESFNFGPRGIRIVGRGR